MIFPFILAAATGVQPFTGPKPLQEYYVNFPEMGAIAYCKAKKEGKSHSEARASAMAMARGSGRPDEWVTEGDGVVYSKLHQRMVWLIIESCPQYFEIRPIE